MNPLLLPGRFEDPDLEEPPKDKDKSKVPNSISGFLENRLLGDREWTFIWGVVAKELLIRRTQTGLSKLMNGFNLEITVQMLRLCT